MENNIKTSGLSLHPNRLIGSLPAIQVILLYQTRSCRALSWSNQPFLRHIKFPSGVVKTVLIKLTFIRQLIPEMKSPQEKLPRKTFLTGAFNYFRPGRHVYLCGTTHKLITKIIQVRFCWAFFSIHNRYHPFFACKTIFTSSLSFSLAIHLATITRSFSLST